MNRKVSYVIVLAMFFVAFATNQNHVSANTTDNLDKEIKDLEEEQNEIKSKKKDVTGEKGSTETKIDENISEQNKVEKEINVIDDKLNVTRSDISSLENEIVETNQEIENLNGRVVELKSEIEILQERIEKRDELLKDRLRAIQKTGGLMKYLDVILGSENFGDFISRSSAVNTIMDQDKTIMEEQEADKLALEDKKEEIETKRAEVKEKKVVLEDNKKELVALEKTLDSQVAEREKLMAQLEEEHEELEEYKLSLDEEQQLLNDQEAALKKAKQLAEDEKQKLEQLAREQEEERKKQAAQSNSGSNKSTNNSPTITSGNGKLIMPASGQLTSPYGYRIHPIHKDSRLHAGIDIGAPTGTTVKAAASGVVGTAGVMGGYGNTIMVTHIIDGQTVTTLYAHLSQISVSTGQTVNQGDVIGKVGSTGQSTGPHLHFEVHPGGYNNPQNPMGFF